ncbi:hypothetical protein GCM10023188_28900 [Pontibacter saemangeumensis]|uniref:Lipoprotein n=1 Tax=Pontibacter saemangeumensis TaxID=1084525 RepID=A0ABP8LTZ7_9BACT
MLYIRLLLPLSLLMLLGCRQNADTPPAAPTDHMVLEEPVTEPAAPEATDKTAPAHTLLKVDTTDLAPEPDTPMKLLLEGSYHKNEVWGGADEMKWLGLYHESTGYVLRPAELKISTVRDPVADGDSLLSGRQVTAADADAMFFVAGLQHNEYGEVDTAAFSRNTVPANTTLIYTFKNKAYKIKAYGDSVQTDSAGYRYKNYGWKVEGSRNGRQIEQTLVEDQHFQDSIYLLLWAGDLDRDGIPDLLLDISNHFNISRYALYLSSMADPWKLYKKVAEFKAVVK